MRICFYKNPQDRWPDPNWTGGPHSGRAMEHSCPALLGWSTSFHTRLSMRHACISEFTAPVTPRAPFPSAPAGGSRPPGRWCCRARASPRRDSAATPRLNTAAGWRTAARPAGGWGSDRALRSRVRRGPWPGPCRCAIGRHPPPPPRWPLAART
eukprot:1178134-Prorocentrum_minimum.AAC.5